LTITYHDIVTQGSAEWYALRLGMLTASEMRLILTPTLKLAANDKERAHVYELVAQRITGFVEPSYVSDDMLSGKEEEFYAREEYRRHYAPVKEIGFVTNNRFGFQIGYSPDGLVGEEGQIEVKSRRQKYQVETIIENAAEQTIPVEYALQVQTGLLVTERKWCDFISYCGGAGMLTIRVYPDSKIQEAIVNAATAFEARMAEKMAKYREIVASKDVRLLPTQRHIEAEIKL
jgi:predicted phage-related endonuclease